ncbi:MAG: chromate resistance protein, partial [Pseudomonadales bacterium]|nr:chromate resistance protein [Pseudomonadales bacterium]
FVTTSCQEVSVLEQKRYISWVNTEPDAIASAWLLSRHLDPGAEVEFRSVNSPYRDGIPFAIAGVDLARDGRHSTFEKILNSKNNDNPHLAKLGQYLNVIEVNPWRVSEHRLAADTITANYRQLQKHFQPNSVPMDCYGAFFDALYKSIISLNAITPIDISQLIESTNCALNNSQRYGAVSKKVFVKEYPTEKVLSAIAAGKRVIFVDVREPQEYEEQRLAYSRHYKVIIESYDANIIFGPESSHSILQLLSNIGSGNLKDEDPPDITVNDLVQGAIVGKLF